MNLRQVRADWRGRLPPRSEREGFGEAERPPARQQEAVARPKTHRVGNPFHAEPAFARNHGVAFDAFVLRNRTQHLHPRQSLRPYSCAVSRARADPRTGPWAIPQRTRQRSSFVLNRLPCSYPERASAAPRRGSGPVYAPWGSRPASGANDDGERQTGGSSRSSQSSRSAVWKYRSSSEITTTNLRASRSLGRNCS
jgi:hypothetical protein